MYHHRNVVAYPQSPEAALAAVGMVPAALAQTLLVQFVGEDSEALGRHPDIQVSVNRLRAAFGWLCKGRLSIATYPGDSVQPKQGQRVHVGLVFQGEVPWRRRGTYLVAPPFHGGSIGGTQRFHRWVHRGHHGVCHLESATYGVGHPESATNGVCNPWCAPPRKCHLRCVPPRECHLWCVPPRECHLWCVSPMVCATQRVPTMVCATQRVPPMVCATQRVPPMVCATQRAPPMARVCPP